MPNNQPTTKLVDSKTIAALFDMDAPPSAAAHQGWRHRRGQRTGNANRYDLLPTIQRYIRYLSGQGQRPGAVEEGQRDRGPPSGG